MSFGSDERLSGRLVVLLPHGDLASTALVFGRISPVEESTVVMTSIVIKRGLASMYN